MAVQRWFILWLELISPCYELTVSFGGGVIGAADSVLGDVDGLAVVGCSGVGG